MLAVIVMSAPAFADSIHWLDSYDAALKQAARDNKPVLAFFYTTWCTYCVKMNAETWTDSGVISASRDFVNVRINGEKDRELVYRYRVGAYPAVVFLDPAGRVIWGEYGFRDGPALAGRIREVISVFRANMVIQPYLQNASEQLIRGRPDKAIDIIDDAITRYPDEPRLYSARGAVFMNMGNIDSALEDLNKSISLNPNASNVYILRSMVYYKTRRLDKALADCDMAISLNKYAYEAYIGRGIILMEEGDLEHAIKNFDIAIVINPRHGGAYFNRAQAYFLMKNYDKSWENVNFLMRNGVKLPPEFLERLKSESGREK